MGGWPTTAFLAADGRVLAGATYLPVDAMIETLRRVVEYWDKRRADEPGTRLAHPFRNQRAPRSRAEAEQHTASSLNADVIDWVERRIRDAFDPLFGGFGTGQKFPQAEILEFLLLRVATCADEQAREILTTSLDRMADGDLYDSVEDGFFRYATRRDWTVPHYEKMLEDNARLLRLYADAAQHFGNAAYKAVALGVAGYLLRVLWQPGVHAFSGSQDADEHYYELDAGGRREHLRTFCGHHGVHGLERTDDKRAAAPPQRSAGPIFRAKAWPHSTPCGIAVMGATP